MKLLTRKILRALPKFYATEKMPLKDKIVICKFFSIFNDWHWYVFEGEPVVYESEEGKEIHDFKFFGMVHGFENEMGYFLLSEITPYVERDLCVFKVPYKELIKS